MSRNSTLTAQEVNPVNSSEIISTLKEIYRLALASHTEQETQLKILRHLEHATDMLTHSEEAAINTTDAKCAEILIRKICPIIRKMGTSINLYFDYFAETINRIQISRKLTADNGKFCRRLEALKSSNKRKSPGKKLATIEVTLAINRVHLALTGIHGIPYSLAQVDELSQKLLDLTQLSEHDMSLCKLDNIKQYMYLYLPLVRKMTEWRQIELLGRSSRVLTELKHKYPLMFHQLYHMTSFVLDTCAFKYFYSSQKKDNATSVMKSKCIKDFYFPMMPEVDISTMRSFISNVTTRVMRYHEISFDLFCSAANLGKNSDMRGQKLSQKNIECINIHLNSGMQIAKYWCELSNGHMSCQQKKTYVKFGACLIVHQHLIKPSMRNDCPTKLTEYLHDTSTQTMSPLFILDSIAVMRAYNQSREVLANMRAHDIIEISKNIILNLPHNEPDTNTYLNLIEWATKLLFPLARHITIPFVAERFRVLLPAISGITCKITDTSEDIVLLKFKVCKASIELAKLAAKVSSHEDAVPNDILLAQRNMQRMLSSGGSEGLAQYINTIKQSNMHWWHSLMNATTPENDSEQAVVVPANEWKSRISALNDPFGEEFGLDQNHRSLLFYCMLNGEGPLCILASTRIKKSTPQDLMWYHTTKSSQTSLKNKFDHITLDTTGHSEEFYFLSLQCHYMFAQFTVRYADFSEQHLTKNSMSETQAIFLSSDDYQLSLLYIALGVFRRANILATKHKFKKHKRLQRKAKEFIPLLHPNRLSAAEKLLKHLISSDVDYDSPTIAKIIQPHQDLYLEHHIPLLMDLCESSAKSAILKESLLIIFRSYRLTDLVTTTLEWTAFYLDFAPAIDAWHERMSESTTHNLFASLSRVAATKTKWSKADLTLLNKTINAHASKIRTLNIEDARSALAQIPAFQSIPCGTIKSIQQQLLKASQETPKKKKKRKKKKKKKKKTTLPPNEKPQDQPATTRITNKASKATVKQKTCDTEHTALPTFKRHAADDAPVSNISTSTAISTTTCSANYSISLTNTTHVTLSAMPTTTLSTTASTTSSVAVTKNIEKQPSPSLKHAPSTQTKFSNDSGHQRAAVFTVFNPIQYCYDCIDSNNPLYKKLSLLISDLQDRGARVYLKGFAAISPASTNGDIDLLITFPNSRDMQNFAQFSDLTCEKHNFYYQCVQGFPNQRKLTLVTHPVCAYNLDLHFFPCDFSKNPAIQYLQMPQHQSTTISTACALLESKNQRLILGSVVQLPEHKKLAKPGAISILDQYYKQLETDRDGRTLCRNITFLVKLCVKSGLPMPRVISLQIKLVQLLRSATQGHQEILLNKLDRTIAKIYSHHINLMYWLKSQADQSYKKNVDFLDSRLCFYGIFMAKIMYCITGYLPSVQVSAPGHAATFATYTSLFLDATKDSHYFYSATCSLFAYFLRTWELKCRSAYFTNAPMPCANARLCSSPPP